MMSIEAPHLKQIENNRRTPSVRRRSLYLGAAGVLLGLAIGLTWIKINVSPSTPLGLYRLHPVARPLTRGTLVIVHVPGWSARTVPFLKPVAAVAGVPLSCPVLVLKVAHAGLFAIPKVNVVPESGSLATGVNT